ncbi:MAG TPA: metal-binding protein [Clostridium sp.]|nr:metal-binding protein [Clostridium sp.]
MDKCKIVVHYSKGEKLIYAEKGGNLLNILRDNKVYVESFCNGKGKCGKCKVKIIRDLDKKTANNNGHLTESEIESGFRLSCETIVNGNLEIVIPEENGTMTVLTEGKECNYELDCLVEKKHAVLDKPCIEDQRDDYRRLSDGFGKEDLSINLKSFPIMGETMRSENFDVTGIFFKNRLLSLKSGKSNVKLYGLAVDVGTTTVAVYLLNLESGKVLDVQSQVNRQRSYGADVISRINFTMENPRGLDVLNRSIIEQINDIIGLLCGRNSIGKDDIYDTVIVGNTTMIHLLLKLTCKYMAMSPYIAMITEGIEFKAREIGIDTGGMVSLIPGISSYVGSDITAGIISSGLLNSERYSLLLDLGTNGEMALGNKNEIITCSTAAGPAFEGANIKCGMGGVIGAISKIDLSKDKIYETIGDVEPLGICGSGVMDMVAQLLSHGIVDKTGKMLEKDKVEDEKDRDRIIREGKMLQFIVARNSRSRKNIIFTQKDIREVQLAKAAVCAGIKILLKEKNIGFDEIEKVYIGGGFGNYMNIKSSMQIGMIPKELGGKLRSIGNCAGSGARMYLLSKNVRDKTKLVVNKAAYIELSKRPDFQDYFIDSMIME